MQHTLTVPIPPRRPLIVFDGDCGFCRYWLARWRRVVGDRFDAEPYQLAASRFPTLQRERFRRAVHLILPDGAVYQGAEAAFRLRALAPGHGGWLAAYRRIPCFRPLVDLGYRLIADHRNAAFWVTRRIWGADPDADRPALRLAVPTLAAIAVAAVAILGLMGGVFVSHRRR